MSRLRLSQRWLAFVFLLVTQPSGAEAELSGRYLLVQRTMVVAKVPVVKDLETETVIVSLLGLHHQGDRLRGRGEVCQVEMRSSSRMVRTELPEAFRRILPGASLDAEIGRNERGLTLRQPPTTVVLGAKLKSPEHDPLPSSAEDPRVVDQDADGHPGVTVRVKGIVSGEVYFTQRGTTELLGQKSERGFSGRVHFKTEDVVLGVSSFALRMRTETQPDFSRSRFRLERVDDAMTCEQARRVAATWD